MRRILIIACSKTKLTASEPMPAYRRYDGAYWRVLRRTLPTLTERPRIFVLSAQYGLISPLTLIDNYDKYWTASNYRDDIPKVREQYEKLVQPLITHETRILAAVGAVYAQVLNECGLVSDCIASGAIYRVPGVTIGYALQMLQQWLTGELDG